MGGHLPRKSASWPTIYHDAERPSRVYFSSTAGTVLETYRSGSQFDERRPNGTVWMDERSD